MRFWKSRKIPEYTVKTTDTKQYSVETTDTKLRLIRTHMAAQAGELSNLLVQVGMVRALLSEQQATLEQINIKVSCEHAPNGVNHPDAS